LGWLLWGVLSAAPCLAFAMGPGIQVWLPVGASLFGVTLMAWLAVCGLPIRPAARNSGLLPVALSLPALGLAAGLDLAQGRLDGSPAGGRMLLLGGVLLVLVWRLSALAGSRHRAAYLRHAWAWGLAVPLSSTWALAVLWAPAPLGGAAQPAAAWLGWLNPLAWCMEWAAFGAMLPSLGAQLSQLALLLAVATASWGFARGARPRELL